MRYYAGKLLELVGLLCVGLALAYGVFQDSMRVELYLGTAGGAIFVLGWLVEGRRRG
ncbi:MAG: hypothetical protein HYZ53_07165 [Planctomycetes bacterium]|nr:hypothetical protein [Planctomycetota bacterium]